MKQAEAILEVIGQNLKKSFTLKEANKLFLDKIKYTKNKDNFMIVDDNLIAKLAKLSSLEIDDSRKRKIKILN